ncbi:---NA---, partial [Paramuricea clavata]
MSSLVHRWLFLCGITLFVFNKGCRGFFLRHTQSGKCITGSDKRVLNVTSGLSYYVVMTDNCLNVSGQFRYRDNEMLQHIETKGTLVAPPDKMYHSRWAVYKGVSPSGESYQSNPVHRLKQTAAGSLQFYQKGTVCAEPSKPYVLSKTYCDKLKEQFTFGSVTDYGAKMENVHCSSMQRMAIKGADYGDFNNNDVFDGSASIDAKCSPLSNCQVKSRCGGKKSCERIMGSNLLPSPYCRDNLKEIYIEYTCVDSNSSSLGSNITAATKMRLTHWANEGFIEIKDGLIWRRVKEEHWDKNRQKMLCQHLGFKEMDTNDISSNFQIGAGRDIATGSLICYSTRPSETSCCINLVRSTSTSNSKLTWAKCKICDKPLSLSDVDTFSPNKVFSGSGGSKYYGNVRSNRAGWCASGSTPYLLLDLQKEYHLTHVMVIADKEQTKWSNSYSMKYSRAETLIGSRLMQITGNQNGYQASITQLDNVYNARYIKIQSKGNTDFCLRIELCGEVQTPAPAYDINITPYKYAARVTWRIRTRTEDSSYITKINLYLNSRKYQTISRRTSIIIKRLEPFTQYKVEIETEDGSSEKSNKVYKDFWTKKAGMICDNPLLNDAGNEVFSGRGGSTYYRYARFTGSGWCASGFAPYLLLDLQKEYHITRVVVMGNKDQTQWSESYSMKYSHDKTLVDTSSAIQ